jgi:hypothetical protein
MLLVGPSVPMDVARFNTGVEKYEYPCAGRWRPGALRLVGGVESALLSLATMGASIRKALRRLHITYVFSTRLHGGHAIGPVGVTLLAGAPVRVCNGFLLTLALCVVAQRTHHVSRSVELCNSCKNWALAMREVRAVPTADPPSRRTCTHTNVVCHGCSS